jgi:hypothetical protein
LRWADYVNYGFEGFTGITLISAPDWDVRFVSEAGGTT